MNRHPSPAGIFQPPAFVVAVIPPVLLAGFLLAVTYLEVHTVRLCDGRVAADDP